MIPIATQCEEARHRGPLAPRRAAFLDRDGTIIEDAHYLSRPEQLRLIPGAAAAIRTLNDAGVQVCVVTNQSGIARGYFTAAEYCRVERALERLLLAAGASLTASYHCPHLPEISGRCSCRKPGTGLFRRAAEDHSLLLAGSLYVGDRWRDVSPALELGGTGILVPSPDTSEEERRSARSGASIADSLGAAVALYLERAGRSSQV